MCLIDDFMRYLVEVKFYKTSLYILRFQILITIVLPNVTF